MADFYGYRQEEFTFAGRKAILVFPKEACKTTKWLLKTEYFGAFPNGELAFLERGYHLAYLENRNRWGLDEDQHDKAEFAKYLRANYGLSETCVPVGMSCGGLHGVDLAALHPEMVSVLYIDAPVINLLSCGGGLGKAQLTAEMRQEMLDALGLTMSEMIAYRKHPLDRLPALIENRIPVVMVYGDSDTVVPYEENGAYLEKAYKEAGIPLLVIGKPGCDHHPHGLEDPAPIVEFVEKYARE